MRQDYSQLGREQAVAPTESPVLPGLGNDSIDTLPFTQRLLSFVAPKQRPQSGTRDIPHGSVSRLETSVGGKTAPGGNPVFQSPPLLSLPRDPVQTSTDLRNLYNPKTVIIQIHGWPRLAAAPALLWEKGPRRLGRSGSPCTAV